MTQTKSIDMIQDFNSTDDAVLKNKFGEDSSLVSFGCSVIVVVVSLEK